MSRVRIYLPKESIKEEIVIKDKDIFHKLKHVLRLTSGDQILIFDGEGKEFLYRIVSATRNYFSLGQLSLVRKEEKIHKRIFLAIPLMKEQKMDLIFQKTTELGVWGFILFSSERTNVKNPSSHRFLRWERIIIEASQQSNRTWIPEIKRPILSFEQLIKIDFPLRIFTAREGENLSKIIKNEKSPDILLAIGPEGDFSFSEKELFKNVGFYPLRLNNNILRSETAAIFSVGLINFLINVE